MAKIYNIQNSQKVDVSECRPFEEPLKKEEVNENASAYTEVLKILKEAFNLVDITKIFKKL